jgi:hypothetical protein
VRVFCFRIKRCGDYLDLTNKYEQKKFQQEVKLSWNICEETNRGYAANKVRNTTNTNDCHYTKKLHQQDLHNLYSPSKIIRVINEGRRDEVGPKHTWVT